MWPRQPRGAALLPRLWSSVDASRRHGRCRRAHPAPRCRRRRGGAAATLERRVLSPRGASLRLLAARRGLWLSELRLEQPLRSALLRQLRGGARDPQPCPRRGRPAQPGAPCPFAPPPCTGLTASTSTPARAAQPRRRGRWRTPRSARATLLPTVWRSQHPADGLLPVLRAAAPGPGGASGAAQRSPGGCPATFGAAAAGQPHGHGQARGHRARWQPRPGV